MTERSKLWTRFWHQPVAAERLALLRIAIGLALLTDQLFQHLPYFTYLYGPEGVAPAGLYDAGALRNWNWTMAWFYTDDPLVVGVVFAVWVGATAALIIGMRTRWAALLAWLLGMAFLNRHRLSANEGDELRQLALFLLIFTPCAEALSWDARREPQLGLGRAQSPWGVRLFQLQLCTVYTATGLAKLRDGWDSTWLAGTSLHYVFNDVGRNRWSYLDLPLPLWVTASLTYATLVFEVFFVPLVLWRKTRLPTLVVGVLFHLGIYAVVEVGWFSFYSIAFYAAWLSDTWIERQRPRWIAWLHKLRQQPVFQLLASRRTT